MVSVDEVMSASEISALVNLTRRAVTNQCKKWEKLGLARKAHGTWIVDKATALAYIETRKKF